MYTNCNVPELDRVESEEPLWLESYGEDDESRRLPYSRLAQATSTYSNLQQPTRLQFFTNEHQFTWWKLERPELAEL